MDFVAFSNVDWAGCVDTRKSTSGAALFLGSCLVSWSSKKQSSITLSTTEAEYVAAATCCTQVLWMKRNLQDIQVTYDEPIPIFCDNTSAISILKNPMMHSKTNHIPIKFHFLRDQVLDNIIKLEYVPTTKQLANIFTNPLPIATFKYLRQQLSIVSIPH